MELFDRFRKGLKEVRTRWGNSLTHLLADTAEDADFWERIEEALISGDVGVELSEKLVADFRRLREKPGPKDLPANELFGKQLERLFLKDPMNGMPLRLEGKPSIVLLAGVNGSGKTTTAGKLASQFAKMGKSVVLAAADTYRAAAIEQLKIWSDRSGARLISHGPGSDPAAVVFDAIQSAKASGADLVVADTAGRLHTRHNLMEELKKIARVVERETPAGSSEFLLVLDAVMGQNAFQQARVFGEALPLSGIVLTKYDNTAKGGVILSVVHELGLPVRYVGLGEGLEDLALFRPTEFVEALLGLPEGALSKGDLP